MSCAHPNIDDKNSASSQQSSGGSGPCAECDKPAKLRCENCMNNTGQMVFYCSKECQNANLPHHKNFCSLPIPSKTHTGPSSPYLKKSVYGIYLPENDAKPVVVEVNINDVLKNDYSKFMAKGGYSGIRYYFGNPYKPRAYEDTLIIRIGDSLQGYGGSKPNKCIQTITGGKAPEPWNGPVLVLKVKGQELHHPLQMYQWLDLYPNEGEYIIDYFMLYGCKERKDELEQMEKNFKKDD